MRYNKGTMKKSKGVEKIKQYYKSILKKEAPKDFNNSAILKKEVKSKWKKN